MARSKRILTIMEVELAIYVNRAGDILRSEFTAEVELAPQDLCLLYKYAISLKSRNSQIFLTFIK